MLEFDHLAGEFVDALRDVGLAAEDLGLDLVDVVGQARHHGGVAVHDGVEDGVEDRLGTVGEQIVVPFESPAHRREVRRLAVPDRHHEGRADEHVQLAEFDGLRRVEVASRLQDDEQRVVVPLELGPLVGLDGVFDGQLVQAELAREGLELAAVRAVETDPRHPVGLRAKALVGLGQRGGTVGAGARDVHGAVDEAVSNWAIQHGPILTDPGHV